MYLRTTQRKNADGTVVRYFQLAENVWDADKGCAVARVIYNFGRADQLDRNTLRRLARSILRVVNEDGEHVVGDDGSLLRIRDVWPLGGVWVIEQLWKQLGIGSILLREASTLARNDPGVLARNDPLVIA
jgi:hypothetical protein